MGAEVLGSVQGGATVNHDDLGNYSHTYVKGIKDSLAASQADNARLRGFAEAVMESWPHGDVDGGALQDIAEEHGLIKLVEVNEPCCEDCVCAEVGSFPLECYRKTSLLTQPTDDTALRQAIAKELRSVADWFEGPTGYGNPAFLLRERARKMEEGK